MRVTGAGEPAHLLLDVLDLVNAFGIPYAVIGAFAVSYHGVPRSTRDGDSIIWMHDGGQSGRDLQDHLAAAGYRVKLRRGDIEDPILQSLLIEDEFDNRVDLLSGVRGMDPDAAYRCVSAPLLDSTVRFIAAEDLIAMKIFAGGPQDMIDVAGILQVSRERLNPDLLLQVAQRYDAGVLDALEKFLKQYPLDASGA